MGDSSDDTGSNASQQSNNAGAGPVHAPNPNVAMDNHAVDPQEQANLRSALENQDLSRIDQIFETNPSLVYSALGGGNSGTPLHFACRNRWGAGVKHLLGQHDIKKSLNHADAGGFLPLHQAIEEDTIEQKAIEQKFDYKYIEAIIDRMKSDDLDIFSKTEDKDTAIHLAARYERIDVLNKLCPMLPRDGVVINFRNKAGCTAIYEGIGSWEVVLCLLRYKASRDPNARGDTLLHAAVSPKILSRDKGSETWRKLLAEGEDRGAQNNDGNTPFHLVADHLNSVGDTSGFALIVLQELLVLNQEATHQESTQKSLVDALQKKNNFDDTVLHIIASKKPNDIIPQTMMQRQAKQAVEDIVSVCRGLLVSRARGGNTPLHSACLANNWAVVEALLQADQMPGLKAYHIAKKENVQGDISLHLAARNGHLMAVKKLMAADESDETVWIRNNPEETRNEPEETRNEPGETPIHVAVDRGQPELLEELLKGKGNDAMELAKCKVEDVTGLTVLHIIANSNVEDKAIRLFDQILDGCIALDLLNKVEPSKRWTPLHFAANRGHERIVEILLLNGADSGKTDKLTRVAADLARRANRVDIASFIRRYRPRSFRPKLEPRKDEKEVDNNFLALSWPKWNRAVRHVGQHHKEPPRTWPELTPVYQLIFNNDDTYCQTELRQIGVAVDKEDEDEDEGFLRYRVPGKKSFEVSEAGDSFDAIDLAPIHQAQIRVFSRDSKGWIMRERRDFQNLYASGKVQDLHTQSKKLVNQTYLYDSMMFQDKKRSTRWIHFPANNVSKKTMVPFQIATLLY